MEIIKDIENLRLSSPSAVTVGTFDGLHKGHFKILEKLFAIAQEKRIVSVLVTFHPHPRLILDSNNDKIGLLTTIEEKIEILKATRLDKLIIIPFGRSFSQISYETFVRDILIKKTNAKSVIVGYDHAFGKNREGNYDKLSELSEKYNFEAYKVEPFKIGDMAVSSTQLRSMIMKGEIEKVDFMLGRKYTIRGEVIKGDARGKEMKFPTANLSIENKNKLLPMNGVYAVDVEYGSILKKGMMNVGYRPTFDKNKERHIEVHIFDFDKEIYGEILNIYIKKRLRAEKKFNSRKELITQLKIDKQKSMKI